MAEDVVNRPSHYTQGGVECIDAIEAALGPVGFVAFLRGQVIKYQWRLGLKDSAIQDAGKAHWYSARLQAALAVQPEGGRCSLCDAIYPQPHICERRGSSDPATYEAPLMKEGAN